VLKYDAVLKARAHILRRDERGGGIKAVPYEQERGFRSDVAGISLVPFLGLKSPLRTVLKHVRHRITKPLAPTAEFVIHGNKLRRARGSHRLVAASDARKGLVLLSLTSNSSSRILDKRRRVPI